MIRGARRPRAGRFLRHLLAAALATAASAPLAARGQVKTPQALPQRPGPVDLDGKRVVVSYAYRDVVDPEIVKKLSSGLPTVIAMRGYVFRESGGDPIALTAKSCRIVYDLWDEVFRIQLAQPGGASNVVAVNVEGVLRNCAEARRIPLVDRALLSDGGRYFVATLIEVNPVSPEMLDRIRKWVTRPTSAIGPGDSLFGSFVGLFVARIGDADRKLAFRTPTFVPPNPPPPSP